MKKEMAFSALVEKLLRRQSWEYLSSQWLDHVPAIEPAGSAPEETLAEIASLEGVGFETEALFYREIPGLRKALLREAVFLLHKCSHVVSVAEVCAQGGQITWSLSDGYHGALYGIRSILAFLGIGFLEFDSYSYVFNIWPLRPGDEHRRKRTGSAVREMLLARAKRIQHRHLWALFCRALRVYSIQVWPPEFVDGLRSIDEKRFTKQRNIIHYSSNRWLEQDLHQRLLDPSFGLRALGSKSIDLEEADFSLSLGLLILHFGQLLLSSLATKMLDPERELLSNKLQAGWHPLFERFLEESPGLKI